MAEFTSKQETTDMQPTPTERAAALVRRVRTQFDRAAPYFVPDDMRPDIDVLSLGLYLVRNRDKHGPVDPLLIDDKYLNDAAEKLGERTFRHITLVDNEGLRSIRMRLRTPEQESIPPTSYHTEAREIELGESPERPLLNGGDVDTALAFEALSFGDAIQPANIDLLGEFERTLTDIELAPIYKNPASR